MSTHDEAGICGSACQSQCVTQESPDLTDFALFSAVTPQDAEALRRTTRVLRCVAGTRIFDFGAPVLGFYLVRSGLVKVFRLSPAGQEQVLAVMGKGQVFAEAALFMKGYPASAECVEDAELLFVERVALLAQLAHDPEMALRMLGGMASKLSKLVHLVDDLTLRDARGRICRYLLVLADESSEGGSRSTAREEQPDVVRLPVSQTLLARLLGLTGETLSRTLKSLRDDGLVQPVSKGRLRLCNPEALRAVVGEVQF